MKRDSFELQKALTLEELRTETFDILHEIESAQSEIDRIEADMENLSEIHGDSYIQSSLNAEFSEIEDKEQELAEIFELIEFWEGYSFEEAKLDASYEAWKANRWEY